VGQTVAVIVLDMLVGVAVCSAFDVGGTDAMRSDTVDVEDGRQEVDGPQTLSVEQQPPPRDAGHERNPEEQDSATEVVRVDVEGIGIVDGEELCVGV